MEAYSARTDTTYESWDDLIEAEADGYVVVSVFERTSKSGRTRPIARVLGRYTTRERAQTVAAYRRRGWNKLLREPGYENVRLLGVLIEPIWKEM